MIHKRTQSFLIAVAIATSHISVVPVLAQSMMQVEFEPNTTSTTLRGTITGSDYFDYIVTAEQDQTMSVQLTVEETNGNGSAFFNILPPESQGEAIFNGATSPDGYGEVRLLENGDYTIRVFLLGDDRDTGKTVSYTVSVNIPAGSSSVATNSNQTPDANLLSLAKLNCLAAVANETGVGFVSAVSVEGDESGIEVVVSVAGAEEPWQCVVATDGKTVTNVDFTGS